MYDLFNIVELIGTVAFAVSGAVVAVKSKLDIFGACVLGIITAVGGGLMRDIVIGNIPPTVFGAPEYSIIALITSLLVFIMLYICAKKNVDAKYIEVGEKILFCIDTLGLAAFTVSGIEACIRKGYDGFAILIFVGAITGTGGGVLRDICAGRIPHIFRKHVYALASIIGSIITAVLYKNGLSLNIAAISGFAIIVIIRVLAMIFKWNLPTVNIDK